jgi:hypothetical protein
MNRLRTRAPRALVAWATLGLTILTALAIALPAPGAAAAPVTWLASVGAAGANGQAAITAPATAGTAGSLKLALKGLSASTTYPVKVQKGTCAAPGSVVFTAPSQKSTAAGKISKVVPVPASKMTAIRSATSLILRVGSGSKLRCGPFTGGPPTPTPTPTATPEPALQAKVGVTADLGEGLSGIAADPAGVWAVELLYGYAYQLDPATGAEKAMVDFTANIQVTFDCVLGEGALWVPTNTLMGAGGTIVRIDPATKTIPVRIEVPGKVDGVAVGGGSVWVAQAGPDQLVRIDPAKNVVAKVYPVKGDPRGVAYGGSYGWILTGDALLRVDLGNSDVTSITLPGQPHGVAFGDGSVWVTVGASGASGSAKLLRYDPVSSALIASIDIVGEPFRIAFGSGYAWLSQTVNDGKPIAVAVSTASNTVAATVPLPDNLPAVAVTGRTAWYAGTTTCCGKVVRIDF